MKILRWIKLKQTVVDLAVDAWRLSCVILIAAVLMTAQQIRMEVYDNRTVNELQSQQIASNTQSIRTVQNGLEELKSLKIEQRLTRLEAGNEINHNLLLAVLLTVLGLFIEAIYRNTVARKESNGRKSQ